MTISGSGYRLNTFNGDFGAYLDTLAGAGTTVGYYRGDLGLSLTGSVVNTWANQIPAGAGVFGNAVEFTGGVGLGTVSTGVGGHAGVAGGASSRSGLIATSPNPLVAPATTPLHVYAVVNIPVGTPGTDQILTTYNSGAYGIYKLNGSPNTLRTNCGSVQDAAIVSGSWSRLRKSFTGSASDILKVGAGANVVGSTGNTAGTGTSIGLFAYQNGAQPSPWDVVLLMFSRATLANFSAAVPLMDAVVTSYFGGTVLV